MKPTAAATSPVRSDRLQKAFHAVGLTVLLTIALYWGHIVLVPLALSILFAFVLSSPAEWVEKRGLGRAPSVLLVTLGAFAVLALVAAAATVQIRGLAADLPQYQANIDRKVQPVQSLLHRVQALQSNLKEAGPDVPPASTQPTGTDAKPVSVVVKPPEPGAISWLPSLARPLAELLVNGVLVVVLTVFMLMQRESFRDRLIRLAGRSRLSSTSRALGDAAARVGKYLLLQLAVNAALGAVVAVGLYFLSVPYALLWGLLVVVLRFVPYVGYWVAALAAVAMSAAVSPGWGHPLIVLAMFAVFDLTLANVIEPLVFSHGTGVSPVALLVAAVFWGFLWGPVGLLLSTPLTVCLAVLGKHVPSLGFLAVLLGDDPSLDPAARFYDRLLARDYDEAAVLLDAYAADHPLDATYDEVILPALAQAKTDREQRDVSSEDEAAVFDATRALLDGLADHGRAAPPTEARAAGVPPVRVIGCAVFGQADDLALRMLGDAIRPAGGELVVTRPEDLVAAVGRAVAEAAAAGGTAPPVACLSTLSPGGMSQARGLLAAVRRAFPAVKLLVGRWGQTGDTTQTEKYLRAGGADDVGWSLRETIRQLVPGAAKPAAPPTGPAGGANA
ncbi:MAG TPA: AI-2E family transporter [Humisphaera sp.]